MTKGSKIDDSLGFYNPDLGRAYIRWTAYPELNKYLLEHEFEHMQEDPDHPTDVDENGIRHKKFFKELLLPLFTGYNAQQKTWSPLGILDPKNLNPPDHADSVPQEQGMMQGQEQFSNPFFNQQPMSQPSLSQPSFGSPAAGSTLPESGQGSLNPGLSQQNLFQSNPQYKYGAPSGRLMF